MISGETEINYFARISLILEANFDDERLLNIKITQKIFPYTALWLFMDF